MKIQKEKFWVEIEEVKEHLQEIEAKSIRSEGNRLFQGQRIKMRPATRHRYISDREKSGIV